MIWGELIKPVSDLLGKFIEDKDQKNLLAHEIATLAEKKAHDAAMAQIEVNKSESTHRTVFVAGWRPSVGWICSFAMAWHFLLSPIAVFVLAVNDIELASKLPEFDMSSLMTILMGMLGLGAYRSIEKIKGVAK